MENPLQGSVSPRPSRARNLRVGVSRGIAAKAMEDWGIASKPPGQRSSHSFAADRTPEKISLTGRVGYVQGWGEVKPAEFAPIAL